jgi:excinuclease UvrABC nuclease subunit
MLDASKKLDFERAAELRDDIERLKSGKKKGRVKYQFAKK